MEINLQELLSNNVILLLFCVIGFGYLIGNIKGSIQVGSTTGVLSRTHNSTVGGDYRLRETPISTRQISRLILRQVEPLCRVYLKCKKLR